ncbi:MAG: nucleotide pyrophosphohydrolase [Burkholderiaceae bacterium]|nr:nucleotide pyrophosphohydrolase [Burkholderiaceae bacterium]
MNIANLQTTLRHFAAEREWQPFHTPKNLVTALMVEAAELAEVFQWMTPEESREAHLDAGSKQRIGEEIADVLLYLLQVADHTQVDVEQAVKDKLVRNAQKYPAKRVVAMVDPAESQLPDTHILLDYENVQPTEVELRAMVPEATRVWVFHGPHQKQVEQRFASFGTGMTTVPISKAGKNALDFHLSFYMGYIASRNQQARFVVVANDKGYEPMLDHARVLGFAVRQHGHARSSEPMVQKIITTAAPRPAAPAAKTTAAKTAAAKKSPAKKAASKPFVKAPVPRKVGAKKSLPKKAAAKKAQPPAAKKAAKVSPPVKVEKPAPVAANAQASSASGSSAMLQKMTDSLRKMGDKRPGKQASLRRALKPLLGASASDESIEVALRNLVARSVVAIGASGVVTYPQFGKAVEASPAKG